MQPSPRIFLISLSVVALGVAGLACSSNDKGYSSGGAAPASAATSAATSAPAAAVVATTTPATAAPANTPVPPPPPASTPVPAPQPTTPPAPAAPPAAATASVSIIDFAFNPNAITARVGQPLTISARNTASAPHTLSITGGASTATLQAGASGTVQVTPTQAGAITFFCMIHGQARMSGQITVTN